MNLKDDIKRQIDEAITAHEMWKVHLRGAINTRQSEFDPIFVRSPSLLMLEVLTRIAEVLRAP